MVKENQIKQVSKSVLAVTAGILLLLILLAGIVPAAAVSNPEIYQPVIPTDYYYLNIDVDADSFATYPCYVVFTFSSEYCTNLSVDYGDGSMVVNLTAASQMLGHTYQSPGTYNVSLSGMNMESTSVSVFREIVVGPYVEDGEITVSTVSSTYLGELFTVSGINTYTDNVSLYIQGTNLDFTPLVSSPIPVSENGKWSITLDSLNITTESGRKLDAGTYTLFATASDSSLSSVIDGPYEKTAIAFRQPFVSGLNCDSSVSRGEILTISGTAYGTDSLMYYIFGPGNLTTGFIEVDAADIFSTEIDTEGFTLGRHFLVIQHPMYDREYNVGPIFESDGTAYFMMNYSGSYDTGSTYLFNTAYRTASNAAQALCDALDSQNSDDLYVRSTFTVYPGTADTNLLTFEADVTQIDETLQYDVLGFCTASSSVSFYVQYPDGSITSVSSASCSSIGEYSAVLSVPSVSAGNYTLYAVAGNPSPVLSSITAYPYETYTYDLSLTGSISAESVLQGSDVYITGMTSSTSGLEYYLFGKKDYRHGYAQVTNGVYNITLDTASLTSGPYSVIIESPGRDSSFAVVTCAIVGGTPSYDFYLYPNGQNTDGIFLFNTAERLGSSAAKALCEALSSESVDDAHLDFSFTVTGLQVSLNTVDDIKLGTNLSVSGSSKNVGSGLIAVSLYPADASEPVRSVLAGIAGDGSWRCTLETASLGLGEYVVVASADSVVRASESFSIREQLLSLTTHVPEVVAQGDSIPISGVADGTLLIRYYLFGTNFFMTGSAPVIDGRYNCSIMPEEDPANGQYFLLVQHPMYDGLFNIGPKLVDKEYSIVLNPSGSYTSPKSSTLFTIYDRQHANAAQALCDSIDNEDIDDIYAKSSFFIVDERHSWSVNGVPSYVEKGDTIVVSGTAGAGKTVTIEMLSTAFAAVPKETVGSAAYISITRKSAADGTWSANLRTSGLNIDEYYVTVSIDGEKVFSTTVCLYEAVPIPPDPPIDEPVEEPDENPKPETLMAINLSAGWNFVSIQRTLDAGNNTAANVFGNVDTAGNAVLGYNAETQIWEQIGAGTVIKPLNAYWIYSAASAEIPLQYSELPVSPAVKSLYKGWNAVGLSAGSKTTATSAFAGVEWRTVLPWSLEIGNWGTPLVNGGSSVNSAEQYLTLGNGSWLYVDADGTLVGLIA